MKLASKLTLLLAVCLTLTACAKPSLTVWKGNIGENWYGEVNLFYIPSPEELEEWNLTLEEYKKIVLGGTKNNP